MRRVIRLAPLLMLFACTEVLDYGPERKLAPPRTLYVQQFEARSGEFRCDHEDPVISTVVPAPMRADCDYSAEPLAGTQSASLINDDYVACDPCWDPADELWVELLFRAFAKQDYFVLPFVPLTSGSTALFDRETGGMLFWGETHPQDEPGVFGIEAHCARLGATQLIPLPNNAVGRLAYHFSWVTGAGELWVDQDVTAAPRIGRVSPDATFKCEPPRTRPTGFYAAGVMKPGALGGTFFIDDVRVAATLQELEQSRL